jgi:hypothetical protein
MNCDVVRNSYIALGGMSEPPLSSASAKLWLPGQDDTFGFTRIVMPDTSSACFHAVQSKASIEEVKDWLGFVAATWPGGITALRQRIVIYPEQVCGSIGTTVICHDPKEMAHLVVAIPVLGSVGQTQKHSGLVSIRHLTSDNGPMASQSSGDTYMAESSESAARGNKKPTDSWAVVASRPRRTTNEVVGKRLHDSHLFDSILLPHVLMQIDNRKVGPGRVVTVALMSDVDR